MNSDAANASANNDGTVAKRPRAYRISGFHRMERKLSKGGLSALDGRSAIARSVRDWRAAVASTSVRFLREARKAKSGSIGKLVRPLRKYETDRPEDEFEVEYLGEKVTVQRRDSE